MNKWPPLTKLWLLVRFHFALLHTCGMGQSLPRRADHLNSKEWGWKSINILHLILGHGPTQQSNASVEATAGLLVPGVHLLLSVQRKGWPLSKEKKIPNYNPKFLREEALFEARPGLEDKRKPAYTVSVPRTLLQSFSEWSNFYAIYLCRKENTAHLSRL